MNVKLIPASELKTGMYVEHTGVWREMTLLPRSTAGCVWITSGESTKGVLPDELVLVGDPSCGAVAYSDTENPCTRKSGHAGDHEDDRGACW